MTDLSEVAVKLSIVCTVKNARPDVESLIGDLEKQIDAPPFELVIVDGESSDATMDFLTQQAHSSFPITPLSLEGNISRGRNAAVAAASTDFILTVDAGVRLPPNWVHQMSRPLLEDQADLVIGAYKPAIPESTTHAAISGVITPSRSEFINEKVLPSARATGFKKSLWAKEGYPEWLDHCEDVVFYERLTNEGARAVRVNGAPVTWDARGTWRAFFRQYRLYARGDAMAGIYARRHFIRYGVYAVLLALTLGGGTRGRVIAGMCWALVIRRGFRRLGQHDATQHWSLPRKVALASVVQAVGDTAKMYGFARQKLVDRNLFLG